MWKAGRRLYGRAAIAMALGVAGGDDEPLVAILLDFGLAKFKRADRWMV